MGGLRRGVVYTIRDYLAHLVTGEPSVLLEEISRPITNGWAAGQDSPFSARRFRPLRDEALSIFRQSLEPAPRETETA